MTTAAIIYVVGLPLFAAWIVFLMVFTNPKATITRGEMLVSALTVVFWPITLLIQVCLLAYAIWEARYWRDYP